MHVYKLRSVVTFILLSYVKEFERRFAIPPSHNAIRFFGVGWGSLHKKQYKVFTLASVVYWISIVLTQIPPPPK